MSGAPTFADIERAAQQIAGAVIRTPFLPAPRLSRLTGADVWVKYENLQATSSFKERGALVKLLSLGAEERQRGVIAMSAGNHAQAVAYHAQRLGIPATIVMPKPTPFVKVGATRAFRATVILEGETLADCEPTVNRIIGETGAILVHPYDDPLVISGQGTIGLEVLGDKPDLDALIVPVGGGGLIAGISIAAKALRPDIEMVGVETELCPSVWAELRGEKAKIGGETLAEGIAVKNVGRITLPIIRELVDHMLLVGEADIERAVAEYLLLQKTMAEGAGAVGLAAMIANPERFAARKVGLVLAGGNIDPRLAASIMVRELARQDRVVAIRVYIDDHPGVLGDVAHTIGDQGGNIIEVSHRRNVLSVPPKGAVVEITLETFGGRHTAAIINALSAAGYRVERLDPPPADPG